jgi:hypothetical protein
MSSASWKFFKTRVYIRGQNWLGVATFYHRKVGGHDPAGQKQHGVAGATAKREKGVKNVTNPAL